MMDDDEPMDAQDMFQADRSTTAKVNVELY